MAKFGEESVKSGLCLSLSTLSCIFMLIYINYLTGKDEVPVVDCSVMEDDLRCATTVLRDYMESDLRSGRCLYVKDYHFFRYFLPLGHCQSQ